MTDKTDQPLLDKEGVPIHVRDTVSSKARAGRHFGNVVDIVVTEEEAKEKNVAHPPKVLFYTQKGKLVQHNPGALIHGENPREEETPRKTTEEEEGVGR